MCNVPFEPFYCELLACFPLLRLIDFFHMDFFRRSSILLALLLISFCKHLYNQDIVAINIFLFKLEGSVLQWMFSQQSCYELENLIELSD